MILSNEQAKAVYYAMCSMNDIGLALNLEGEEFSVEQWGVNGKVYIFEFDNEQYNDRCAFAQAYKLI